MDVSTADSIGCERPPDKRKKGKLDPEKEMTAFETATLSATTEANERRTQEMVRLGTMRYVILKTLYGELCGGPQSIHCNGNSLF